jgi:hypothetical protein
MLYLFSFKEAKLQKQKQQTKQPWLVASKQNSHG